MRNIDKQIKEMVKPKSKKCKWDSDDTELVRKIKKKEEDFEW